MPSRERKLFTPFQFVSRYWLYLDKGLLCIILFLGSPYANCVPVFEAPDLVDLGVLERNPMVEGSFSIRNSGDAPLNVSLLGGSCACTVATFDNSPLQPKEERVVYVKINPQKFHGMASIFFRSDAPATPQKTIKVKATFISSHRLNPEVLVMHKPYNRESEEGVRVMSLGNFDATVTDVHIEPASLETRIEESTKLESYVIVTAATSVNNVTEGLLTLTTHNNEKTSKILVPVRVMVQFPIRFSPGFLLLRNISKRGVGETVGQFVVHVEPGIEIEKIEVSQRELETSILKTDSCSYLVKVKLKSLIIMKQPYESMHIVVTTVGNESRSYTYDASLFE